MSIRKKQGQKRRRQPKEDKLTVRDAGGNNIKFSKRLNKAIQDVANYTAGAILNIRELWAKVKQIAKEEGVDEEECQREFRYSLKGN